MAIALLFAIKISAQIGINATKTIPNVFAMLDVASLAKGALLPRMNTIQRPAIPMPALGLTVFDTDTKSYWYYDGSKILVI